MSNARIVVHDAEVRKWLNGMGRKIPAQARKAVNNTAGYAKRLAGLRVSRLTGNLARSYQISKSDDFEREVNTEVFYADFVEDGTIKMKAANTVRGDIFPSVQRRFDREMSVAMGRAIK